MHDPSQNSHGKITLFRPDGSAVPVQREAPKPHQLQVSGEGEDQTFRWVRNDGKAKSPIFTTLQEALAYAAVVPLLTRDEWLAMEVPPEWLALNEVQSEGPPEA